MCFLSVGSSGRAEPGLRDLQVAVRALAFLEEPPVGPAEIGIVYGENSVEGLAQALRVAASFGDGLRAGNLTLRPSLMAVREVRQGGVVALLLTDSALPHTGRIAQAVARTGIVTITAGAEAAEPGTTVLRVRASPRVEIVVDRIAAEAAGVSFAAAFRMMIQER
ncbi:hypothetical protein J8J14_21420 [Roseomonas sp. SSH11]|uniref:Uncharacterized protein n=1 Tax=Pararoseomonas baculiformis TaxID=2820812 RepID=A0ABS4AJW4_9PROT|nr:hypothetical protein [Pararoseomonas baculiformis]MBP0447332.1 hypothetical protein [Pararoseomonas baculiformis]